VAENAAGRDIASTGVTTLARVRSAMFSGDLRRIEEETTKLEAVPHVGISHLLLRICSKILRVVTPPPIGNQENRLTRSSSNMRPSSRQIHSSLKTVIFLSLPSDFYGEYFY
jgi:hypothetical protein